MKEKTYVIGEKKYVQRPIVLGQVRQLTDLFKDVVIPEDLSITSILMSLGSNLGKAIAIVLTEEGVSLRNKNIEESASDIEFNITPEQALEVVEDFFGITDISLVVEKFNGMMLKMVENIGKEKETIPPTS
jgi:hypothetical protein